MKLIIFTLFFCSSAESSFPVAAGNGLSTGLGITIKYLPATHKKRHRGQRPRHHDQVPTTNSTAGRSLALSPRGAPCLCADESGNTYSVLLAQAAQQFAAGAGGACNNG
jgi:hypothetical protein